MRRAVVVGFMMLAAGASLGSLRADAQTAMREDTFDVQTALHYYGFMDGPVDGQVGRDTVDGLRDLGGYLRLGPVSPTALEAAPLPVSLRALLDAYVTRNDVDTALLDERDLGRLNREGERFWIRKELQPDPDTWGVEVDRANDTCGAWANEDLIGQVIDPSELPEIEGAGSVRVVYFGPVTADFRPDRLNLFIDPWNMVTNTACN